MNKKLNAVALANKALRRENADLWDKLDLLERGTEELKSVYEAMIMQLTQLTGGELVLAKTNVSDMMERYELRTEITETGLRLRVVERADADR